MKRLLIVGAILLASASPAQADRYDPTTDPNVGSYMVCVQLASGGGDNSGVDPSKFDEEGDVEWIGGTGTGTEKVILCQNVTQGETNG